MVAARFRPHDASFVARISPELLPKLLSALLLQEFLGFGQCAQRAWRTQGEETKIGSGRTLLSYPPYDL